MIEALPGATYDDRAGIVREILEVTIGDGDLVEAGLGELARLAAEPLSSVVAKVEQLPGLDRAYLERLIALPDEAFAAARTAYVALVSQVGADRRKAGRARARVRLGQFVSALALDQANERA